MRPHSAWLRPFWSALEDIGKREKITRDQVIKRAWRQRHDGRLLNEAQRRELAAVIERGPIPAVDGVVRWRLIDLVQWLVRQVRHRHQQADAQPDIGTAGLPQALGASAPSRTRPRSGRGIQKKLPERLAEIAAADAAGKPIEIWFADEARIGQKNKIARRWAKRGTRPSARADQRTGSTYIFGAICPARGTGAGLVLPFCNSVTMSMELAEISQTVSAGAHAVLLLDQAGWHTSHKLVVPANVSLLPLPPKSPELNPTENIWQYLRDNWLSNRVFASVADIVDHCCPAWNKLIDQPWIIMSIGLRDWAHT